MLWQSLGGTVRFRLTCADPAAAMSGINAAGIPLFNAVLDEELTMEASVRRCDFRRLRKETRRRGGKLEILSRSGIYWRIKASVRRPVLLTGFLLAAVLVSYLGSHILFVRVEGNHDVPERYILEQAEKCGIALGVSRRSVRSEQMKNRLLASIPALEWAGVNTSGCVATISVREREIPEDDAQTTEPGEIVAGLDGVIQSVTVRQGTGMCRVGQAVRAGEVLISGYTDLGLCIRADPAEGEITADTNRKISARIPADKVRREGKRKSERKISLIIGKKRIKFYKGSGISDGVCVKMSCVKELTLPGGFVLPVAIQTDRLFYYDTSRDLMQPEEAEQLAAVCAEAYLKEQMLAGRILSSSCAVRQVQDGLLFSGSYACREMIGRAKGWRTVNNYE